ncbi:acyltransferase domain-containing protein [Serratia ureilytica]
MASDLMAQDATFRKLMNDKLQIVQTQAALDLSALFTGEAAPESINDTALTQPALIAVEISMAELLMHYGVEPDWVIGHSLGEIAAAWAAGVFSVQEALVFAAHRGRLMAGLPSGMMLAVELSVQQVQPWLSHQLSLAAENSDDGCVLSGTAEAIRACERQMRDRGVRCKALNVSHAFHSTLMDPILDELADIAPPPGESATGYVTSPPCWRPKSNVRHLTAAIGRVMPVNRSITTAPCSSYRSAARRCLSKLGRVRRSRRWLHS